MRAFILAAGRGVRMGDLTGKTPKPLLLVAGKPLIVWQIERLAAAGFREIVINHAYLGEQIEAVLKDGSSFGVRIRYSPEVVALETAGGIVQALPLLGDQPFLAVNADIFTDYDFGRLQKVSPQQAHLVLANNPGHHPEGDFCLQQGRVVDQGGERLTFTGIGVYHPQLFSGLPTGEAVRLAPLLRAAVPQGISAEHYTGCWVDVGTSDRLQEVNRMVEARCLHP